MPVSKEFFPLPNWHEYVTCTSCVETSAMLWLHEKSQPLGLVEHDACRMENLIRVGRHTDPAHKDGCYSLCKSFVSHSGQWYRCFTRYRIYVTNCTFKKRADIWETVLGEYNQTLRKINSENVNFVRFEVFTAVTMKNAVFLDVVRCSSCVNERFGGTYRLHLQGRKIRVRATSVSRWLHTGLHGATSQKTAFFNVNFVYIVFSSSVSKKKLNTVSY
jgi:hypothetical protein